MTTSIRFNDDDALQARLAVRLAAGLSESTASLPHDIGERLRVAREQAVNRAREVRRPVLSAAASVVGHSRGAAVLGQPTRWWQQMASVLPLLVLLAGLFVIEQWNSREQVLAAADIDAVLLADDLPPDAYTDPGFGEYLKTPLP